MALFSFLNCSKSKASQNYESTVSSDFYSFKILNLDEDDIIDFADFKGKKLLLVNVASRCGYTPQYKGLQELYENFKDDLVVVGLPCNQFMFQEPASNDSIRSFCSKNYGVSFPMTSKIKVKGSDQHPLYQWLTQKELNGKGDFTVSWNFNKFLISEEGELLGHFDSKVKPMDQKILQWIES